MRCEVIIMFYFFFFWLLYSTTQILTQISFLLGPRLAASEIRVIQGYQNLLILLSRSTNSLFFVLFSKY